MKATIFSISGSESGSFDWFNVISALGGSLIGGIFALVAVLLAARKSQEQATELRKTLVIGSVKAIWSEMTVNYTRYENTAAPFIRQLKNDEILDLIWPVKSDYFSVYAANAGHLGEIDNNELSKDIIECVTASKGLVDSLEYNSSLLLELRSLNDQITNTGNNEYLEQKRIAVENLLVQYASGLKNIDVRISEIFQRISPKIQDL